MKLTLKLLAFGIITLWFLHIVLAVSRNCLPMSGC